MANQYDAIIIGGGPAGLSAAVYCARANLACCIIEEKMAGGRPLGYLEIENYLGLGRISTFDMVEKFREHVELFNVPIFECEQIKNIDLDNKVIETDSDTYEAKAIIIATGSRPRLLGVPGEKEFTGKGVHYCAICDGPLYKDKVVAVIGGGNSACEEALGLAEICEHVEIIEFTDKLNADQVTLDKIYNAKNIGVSLNCQVQSIVGDAKVNGVYFKNRNLLVESYFAVDAVFPYIGMTANSELFDVEKDAQGFICSNAYMQTSKEGVFVAGDVRAKVLRQVITAVADGAIAGVEVGKYLRLK